MPHIRLLRIEGPGPFVTRFHVERGGEHVVWLARRLRKGLERSILPQGGAALPFWLRPAYNWSTGAFFAVGSLLFLLGSLFALLPAAAAPSVLAINIVFFLGSIPFTIAGYLQHFQAANAPTVAPGSAPGRIALIGWNPRSAGWLSTFTQFIGTLAFNVSTFDAILAPRGWIAQDVAVWTPDMFGSVMFLASGYLAFLETSHAFWSWKPRDLAWQIVSVNLLGCIFFMTAGILSYVPERPEAGWIIDVSNVHLLLGALGFLIGAALTMRESRSAT